MPLGNAHLQLMRLAQKKKMAGDVTHSMTKAHSKTRSMSGSEDSTLSTMAPLSPTTSEEFMVPNSPTKSEECMSFEYKELQDKFEQLQLDYEDKCNEVVECQNDLKAARMEIQELQLLLKSRTGGSSIVPAKIATGSSGPGVAGNSAEELRRMFCWLAEQVDLNDKIEWEASEHTLMIGGQQVPYGNIVQWRLKEGDLRLTVPVELAPEVSKVLAAAKADPAAFCNASAKTILDSWLLSVSEPASAATSAVTMLMHRQSSVNCMVANFPVPHSVQESGGYRVGETVEVYYEGQWYIGAIKVIKCHGEFFVQCEIDPPGTLTKGFSSSLRRPVITCAEPKSDVADVPISESTQPKPQEAKIE